MEKWQRKIAIVTGASAGIGAATAKALVQAGMKVVGFARRKERIEQLAAELDDQAGKLYAVKVDLTQEQDILDGFKWNLSPGAVNTEIAIANNLISEEAYKKMIQNVEFLKSEDVADAILYLLGTPLRVQVTELIIRPIRETNRFQLE
ncbi:short chain dehydrogenase [Popillia japonica]|uniref:Short chain dehydrogenase n=1 Tax=Popillia japonica TaxID=7064 RepID=A0AAW1LEF0_POPJA